MIIKLDIDGVLRDMETPMIRLYNEKFQTCMKLGDLISYDIDESFPLFRNADIDTDGYKFFFEDHLQECYIEAKAYEGAAEAVKLLQERGHVIHIVSFQPSLKAQKATLEWLNINNIEFDNITFTNIKDKTCVPCDVIVDDCPEYIDSEPESVLKVCINHSYNMDCNAIHFDSIYSFAKLICNFDLHIMNRNNFIIYTKKE